jgi:hypothetical protein
MHSVLLIAIVIGGLFGWIWKRFHVAVSDVRSATTRLKGARAVLRREIVWTAGAIVVAYLLVRFLL